jgi:hypothetical protein
MSVVKEPPADPAKLRDNIQCRQIQVLGAVTGYWSELSDVTSASPSSFSQGPKDEWDRKMKENYEQGGVLKELSKRGREDYQTGNTSPLP